MHGHVHVKLCTALRQQLHTHCKLVHVRLCFSNAIPTRYLLIDTIDTCILKRAHAGLPLPSLRLLKFKASKQHLANEQSYCVSR